MNKLENVKFKITLTYLIFIALGITSCKMTPSSSISYPDYHRNFINVKSLVDNNELGLAITKFDVFSKGVSHVPSNDLLFMASAIAETQDCRLCRKYLELSIQNGLEIDKVKESNNIFQFCRKEVELLGSKVDNSRFNKKYKSSVDSMFKIDQDVRMQSDYEKMRIVDSMNMNNILSLIDEFGYPSEKLIGKNSASRAFILILHMDQDIDNQVLEPILIKAYSNGYIAPRQLAWIIDRRRNWGPKALDPYFYQIPSKNYDSLTIEQKSEIDFRRDSIGLERI